MTTRYLPYTLELRSPLLATTPGSDPNSAATMSWIPGSFVRGAVARALGGSTDPDFVELILDGSVRYLNAYPVSDTGVADPEGGKRLVRTVPAPLSLREPKYPELDAESDDGLIDLAAFDGQPGADHETAGHWPLHQVKPVAAGFLELGSVQSAAPVRLSGRIHQQRDRAKGRAWTDAKTKEAHGTVFGYEAIDAGQEFAGVVAIDTTDERAETLAAKVTKLLSGVVMLGRSRRAGYGGDPTIRWGELRDDEVAFPPRASAGLAAGQTICLLLTSPYVGRDPETGQPDPTCLVADLRSQPGLDALESEAARVRWAFTEVGGYNRRWQLPLPQRQAVAAGSVLVLRAHADVDAGAMQAIVHRGVGDRRLDGFGRIAWLDAPTPVAPRIQEPPAGTSIDRPTSTVSELALQIERRIAGQRLERVIEETAAAIAASSALGPKASLLGRLRVPMRLGAEAGLGELSTWLSEPTGPDGYESGRLRPPARRQLERCRVTVDGWGSVTLAGWLRQVTSAECDERVATLLGLADIADAAHVCDSQALLTHLRSPEYLRNQRAKLIDGVFAWLQRRAKATNDRTQKEGKG